MFTLNPVIALDIVSVRSVIIFLKKKKENKQFSTLQKFG